MATDRPAALTLASTASTASTPEPQPSERLRYTPPQLRHLGSVRDLTLGLRAGGIEPGMVGMMV